MDWGKEETTAGVRVAVQTTKVVWARAGVASAASASTQARAASAMAGNRGRLARGYGGGVWPDRRIRYVAGCWALGETSVRAGMVTRRSGSSAVPISVVFDSIAPPKPGSSKASPAGFWKLIAW